MKKLNLNNKVLGDDDKLISILKELGSQEPSPQFVEKTLEEFRILRNKQKRVYRPLKSPLYMMLVIGVILFVPVLFTFIPQISLPNPGLKMDNLFENISFQLDSWYTLTLIPLILVLISVVWFEAGYIKFRNPFV